ncbi:MAG: squalene/phytoene synthase family protein [Elusimicrobiales bacterium]|jgi:farnesyl-diphosphate farnesyltransferase
MTYHKAGFSGDLKGILKDVSRTLYLSIKILPEPLKTSMAMGYLVARTMDTVTDCPALDAASKRGMLALFRGLENRNNAWELGGRIKQAAGSISSQKEKELLFKFEKIAALYAAFSEAELAPLKALVDGVAKGMEMDLDVFQGGAGPEERESGHKYKARPAESKGRGVTALKTEDELKTYCALIGGEPGIFWARLYRETIRRNNINFGKFSSDADAGLIGSALQITNVLKDLAADLRMGRCYLPLSDLNGAGLKPEDLLDPKKMERLRPVVYKWICWAVDQLDLSEAFLSSVPKTEMALRAAFIWPVYWAMDTLQEIARANLLDPLCCPKIKRSRIYSTILSTPPLLLSNTAFANGYRFRRETLIVQISGR